MAIYNEKPEKLSLSLSSSSNKVTLTLNTYHGTVSGVSWIFNDIDFRSKKGEPVEMGTAAQLKGKTIYFDGSSNNPSNGKIKVECIIKEENGNTLTYIFPDDFEGSPAFDTTDAHPANSFEVKFS